MSAGYLLSVVGLLVVSVLAHYIGRGGRAGSLARGRGPGIRTTDTVASQAAWLAGHRAAAPWMLAAAGVGYLLVVVCVVYPVVVETAAGAVLPVPMFSTAVFGVVVAVGVVRANRAARAVGWAGLGPRASAPEPVQGFPEPAPGPVGALGVPGVEGGQ